MFGASGKQAAPRRVQIRFLIAPRGARSKTSISITVPRNRDVPSASGISSSLGVSFLPNPWTHDESALLLGELSLARRDGGRIMMDYREHTGLKSREPHTIGLFVFMSLAALLFLVYAVPALGQSTFGSILGTVKDPSGDVVPGASVMLTNRGTSAVRTLSTDQGGSYSFVNVDAGNYELTVEVSGFQKIQYPTLDLQARETKRVDANLKVASQNQTVMVEGTAGAVVTTDVSNLAETKTGKELVDLPVAIYSRGVSGSTSPISTLTTQPGVQTDDNNNLTVAGTTPALMSYTIDGISSVNVESSGPINELFSSFNSIEEIRVSETNNNAEFSGVSDVTTTSKSG